MTGRHAQQDDLADTCAATLRRAILAITWTPTQLGEAPHPEVVDAIRRILAEHTCPNCHPADLMDDARPGRPHG